MLLVHRAGGLEHQADQVAAEDTQGPVTWCQFRMAVGILCNGQGGSAFPFALSFICRLTVFTWLGELSLNMQHSGFLSCFVFLLPFFFL